VRKVIKKTKAKERRARDFTVLNKSLRSPSFLGVFYKTIFAQDAQKLTAIEWRNGYVLDHWYLLLLLWDVRFNQAIYRPASDRNALPGGDDHQSTAPAEDIFDFSQDSRTSRLLPAVDRAFDSDTDNSIRRVVCHLLVWKRAALSKLRRILAESQTDIELGRAEPEQMDGRARWIYSSDNRRPSRRFMMFTEVRGSSAIDNDLSAVTPPGT